jgi:hypothetical protein
MQLSIRHRTDMARATDLPIRLPAILQLGWVCVDRVRDSASAVAVSRQVLSGGHPSRTGGSLSIVRHRRFLAPGSVCVGPLEMAHARAFGDIAVARGYATPVQPGPRWTGPSLRKATH